MPWIVETFESIPDDKITGKPHPNLQPAGWIFGNMIVKERIHVGGFLQGIDDVPQKFRVFLPGTQASKEERKVAIQSKDELISYWKEVRAKTLEYLSGITDENLKEVPKKSILPNGAPNRDNPIREAFVMTIWFQNNCWGQLVTIKRIFGVEKTRPETWL